MRGLIRGFSQGIRLAVLAAAGACLLLGARETVVAQQASPTGQRWAVLVGVNEYAELANLRYCVADVRKLRDRLIEAGFPKENVFVLADDADRQVDLPFRTNIQRRLDAVLRVVREDDLVLVAFSGHGVHLGGKSYFCPTDADLGSPETTMVPLDYIYRRLDGSAARQKVLLVDACRNDPRLPGERDPVAHKKSLAGLTEQLKTVPEGITTLSSAAAGQISWEDETLGHGVFMYYVMEGLTGKADEAGNRDGVVSLLELYNYAYDRTTRWAMEHRPGQRNLQTPELLGKIVGDMALAYHGVRVEPEPLDESFTLSFAVRAEDDKDRSIEGVLVEVFHRPPDSSRPVLLGSGRSGTDGRVSMEVKPTISQQAEGDFITTVSLAELSRTYRLERFPQVRSYRLRLPPISPGLVHPSVRSAIAKVTELGGTVSKDSQGRVVEVHLHACAVRDEHIASLTTLTDLRKLTLSGADITDEGVKQLVNFKQLEELVLENTSTTDDGIRQLTELTKLRSLCLRRATHMTDAAMGHLKGLPELEELSLMFTNVTDEGLRHIGGMARLRLLDLRGCLLVTDAGLAHIAGLDKLATLRLRTPGVTDTGIKHIAGMQGLRSLSLEDVAMSDAALQYLENITELSELTILRTSVSDTGLKRLRGFKKMRILSLRDAPISGEGIAYLSNMTNLEQLDLSETHADNRALEVIGRRFTKLRRLTLRDTRISDEGLEHLSQLAALQSLSVQNTEISDAGLIHIGQIGSLEELNLPHTHISNAGVTYLHSLRNLKRLDMSSTTVTAEAVENLQAALPECQIVR